MLLEGYTKEIFRPECNHQFESLHCFAHLETDISCVFPYLNETLGGHHYQMDPPALTLKVHGKLITLHPRMIALNALRDEVEADRILDWLRTQINEVWDHRHEIEPSTDVPRPRSAMELLKHLPRTNCGECGQPTCLVFALRLAEDVLDPDRCPALTDEQKSALSRRLGS